MNAIIIVILFIYEINMINWNIIIMNDRKSVKSYFHDLWLSYIVFSLYLYLKYKTWYLYL
jgi:hypothetical protein